MKQSTKDALPFLIILATVAALVAVALIHTHLL